MNTTYFAERLGVSRNRIHSLAQKNGDPDFPSPVSGSNRSRLYRKSEADEYIDARLTRLRRQTTKSSRSRREPEVENPEAIFSTLVGYDYFAEQLGVKVTSVRQYAHGVRRLKDFPPPTTPPGVRTPLWAKTVADKWIAHRLETLQH